MWKRLSAYAPSAGLLTYLAYIAAMLTRGRHPDLGTATAAALGTTGVVVCVSLVLAANRVSAAGEELHDLYEYLRNNRLYLIVGGAAGAWVSAQAVFDAFR